MWGWWRLPTDGLPRLAGAGFNPSCKDDPGRFVGEGAGRDVNTFGPVFYLARTDTRCWTAGLGGNTLRGCAELRAVVARCRARSPVQFRAAPVASALPPQRRALFPLRSRRAFRSRRCPADHWPVAQDRPRSMLLAVLLALNPFRDIPIVTLRLQGSASRTIPLAGAQQVRNIGRLLQPRCSPRQSSRECLSNGQIQIIALQIQSIAVLLDVMRLFRLAD